MVNIQTPAITGPLNSEVSFDSLLESYNCVNQFSFQVFDFFIYKEGHICMTSPCTYYEFCTEESVLDIRFLSYRKQDWRYMLALLPPPTINFYVNEMEGASEFHSISFFFSLALPSFKRIFHWETDSTCQYLCDNFLSIL